jgi:hypothetical protein
MGDGKLYWITFSLIMVMRRIYVYSILYLYLKEVPVKFVPNRFKGWWGHVLKEKAYVQKELAAGTGLIIGVPFYAEGSGGLFLKLYSYI